MRPPERLQRLLRLAVLAAHLLPAAASAGAGPAYPGAVWAQAGSAESGWSASKLDKADDLARAIGTDAYLVVHRGERVHQFGDIAKPMNLASVRKSVLSVLIGIEVDRGRFDLDRTLGELGIGDKQGLSDIEKTATVRHLLQARSGVYHPAAYETAAAAAERPERGSHDPGEHWYYNNWDFNALSTIFRQFTGKTVFESLNDELARPLGFEDFRPERDTQFVYSSASRHPAYLMRLSARDLARVGLLMSRGGRWKDRQVVSSKWIAESTAPYSEASSDLGFGYLWWVGFDGAHYGQRFPAKVYSARGNFGQVLLVDPHRDIVIVHRVDMDRFFKRSARVSQMNELLGLILAAVP